MSGATGASGSSTIKQKLQFEKTPVSQREHIKGAVPLRPVKAAGNALILNAHHKIYQVEDENVSVKAAHRAEMLAEGGVRSALRFHKTAPYQKVAKLERVAQKKSINLSYQKTLAENPKLKSNIITRTMQKRKIKKDYAKAAREAQKTAKRVKQAGETTARAGRAIVSAIGRHPVAVVVAILIILLIFSLMSLVGALGGVWSGGLGGILNASYLAEDADIDSAEIAYTEWETDLQIQIADAETDNPGYDEYRYNIGDIGHNPYELMAYLTAKYQNFTYSAVETELLEVFSEQYTLTLVPTVETHYHTVTKTNPDTGEDYDDEEPYDWNVLTVTLAVQSLTDIAAERLTDDQLAHYVFLSQTTGNRQYVGNPFGSGMIAFNWQPYISSYYGYRVHPVSGEKDLHRGIDIAMPEGTPIMSAQNGTVTFAGDSGDYGNVVVIENSDGIVTKYAHCETLFVSVGQTVNMGDTIATVGNTGVSTGAHLHFEVMKDGIYLNPAYFANTGG